MLLDLWPALNDQQDTSAGVLAPPRPRRRPGPTTQVVATKAPTVRAASHVDVVPHLDVVGHRTGTTPAVPSVLLSAARPPLTARPATSLLLTVPTTAPTVRTALPPAAVDTDELLALLLYASRSSHERHDPHRQDRRT